jgi:predicted alpha/beta-fold hydrolase
VTLELSRHGGHVGFVAGGLPCRARYWLEARICAHLRKHL